jgi:hypothetical protein
VEVGRECILTSNHGPLEHVLEGPAPPAPLPLVDPNEGAHGGSRASPVKRARRRRATRKCARHDSNMRPLPPQGRTGLRWHRIARAAFSYAGFEGFTRKPPRMGCAAPFLDVRRAVGVEMQRRAACVCRRASQVASPDGGAEVRLARCLEQRRRSSRRHRRIRDPDREPPPAARAVHEPSRRRRNSPSRHLPKRQACALRDGPAERKKVPSKSVATRAYAGHTWHDANGWGRDR